MTDFFQMIRASNLEDITRELRLLAIEERMHGRSDVEKKNLLTLIVQFLNNKPLPGHIDPNSPQFFKQTAYWLYEKRESNDKALSLAVIAWKTYLEKMIPSDFPVDRIISLGAPFFEVPYQLAAFLSYLLDHGVTASQMIASRLLHHYFEIEYTVSFDDFKLMYHIIPDSVGATQLKRDLSAEPVRVPIFLNLPSVDSEKVDHRPFFSLNVMGEPFSHDAPFDKSALVATNQNQYSLFIDESCLFHINPLFEVFGWELIKSLDFSVPFSSMAFKKLLSHYFDFITKQLPSLSLTHEIHQTVADEILYQLSQFLIPDRLEQALQLIQQDPFYLNLYASSQTLPDSAFVDVISSGAEKMLLDSRYVDPRNLLFVSRCCEWLDKNKIASHISIKLKDGIFNTLLDYDELMQDETIEKIMYLDGLSDLALQKLTHYQSDLSSDIQKWIAGEVDYYAVLVNWEGKQKHINVLLDIDKAIRKKCAYPTTGYELNGLLVQRMWNAALQYQHRFDVKDLLEQFCIRQHEDNDQKNTEIKRILQEILLSTQDNRLIEYLIQWIENNHFNKKDFYQMPFGDGNTLIEKSVSYANENLFHHIVHFAKWNDEFLYRVVFDVLSSKNFHFLSAIEKTLQNKDYLNVIFNEFYIKKLDEAERNWNDEDSCKLINYIFEIPQIKNVCVHHRDIFLKMFKRAVERNDIFIKEHLISSLVFVNDIKKFKIYFNLIQQTVSAAEMLLILEKMRKINFSTSVEQFLNEKHTALQRQHTLKLPRFIAPVSHFFDEEDWLLLGTAPTASVMTENQHGEVAMREESGTSTQTNPIEAVSVTYHYPHFHALSQNEYSRYAKNSAHIGFVLEENGKRDCDSTTVFQYPTHCFEKPTGFTADGDLAPMVLPISQLVSVKLPNGEMGMQGFAGTEKMNARRRYHFTISADDEPSKEYTFYPMSPLGNAPAFFGPMPLAKKFNDTEEGQALKQMPTKKKESDDLVVKNEDVPTRALQTTRTPDQKTVMGSSAVDFYRACIDQYRGGLSVELVQLMERAFAVMHLQTLAAKERKHEPIDPEVRSAAFRDRLIRPELLHRHSYTLHPMNQDPQTKDNLGAARLCHNTAMMILERTVRWFALHVPQSSSRLNCQFTMLLDTEVISHIYFVVMIAINNIHIQIKQEIDALEKNPQFVKASDLAGLVAVLAQLINHAQAASVDSVPILPHLSALTASAQTLFQPHRKREREEEESLSDTVRRAA